MWRICQGTTKSPLSLIVLQRQVFNLFMPLIPSSASQLGVSGYEIWKLLEFPQLFHDRSRLMAARQTRFFHWFIGLKSFARVINKSFLWKSFIENSELALPKRQSKFVHGTRGIPMMPTRLNCSCGSPTLNAFNCNNRWRSRFWRATQVRETKHGGSQKEVDASRVNLLLYIWTGKKDVKTLWVIAVIQTVENCKPEKI